MGKLANPCAKNDIIDRLSTGESSNQIANDYDVSVQIIRQIIQNLFFLQLSIKHE